jgi:hypothetical protein
MIFLQKLYLVHLSEYFHDSEYIMHALTIAKDPSLSHETNIAAVVNLDKKF